MPITADLNYYIDSATAVLYRPTTTTKIYCPFEVNKEDITLVHVQVWDNTGAVFYAEVVYSRTETELEAHTGTGTGEFTQMKSVVELDVKAYLEAIVANSGVTFTISA